MVRVIGLLSVFVCGAVVAQSNSSARLDEFFQGLQTLQADFRQELRDSQGRLIETSKGTLWIRRPDRFRWDYAKPAEQVIVADGKRLWLHDVDLEQVTVKPLAQSLAGTPASLLSGADDLRGAFNVETTETKGTASIVTLSPKRSDTDFKRVRISFNGKQLDSMELSDTLGQSTLLEFSNVRRNAAVDDSRFVFTPPAGADVIGSLSDGNR